MFFGQQVHDHGLATTYESVERFNHPPLMGLYAAGVWDITGDDLSNFARLIKIPGLIGEAIALVVLSRMAGLPAFAVYAAAPAAVLVSSYHGNTDTLYAALLLLAALAFDRQRFLWAGLLFGAALNVKLLPLVLLPLLVIAAPNRRATTRILAGLAIAALPYLPFLATSGAAMYERMLAYNSVSINWGVLAFLNPASLVPEFAQVVTPLRDAFVTNGRYLIIALIVLLALASRLRLQLPMIEQLALGGALFLFLAPGFGVQYVVLIGPLLVLVSLPYALAWLWLAGAFIGVRYSAFPVTGEWLLSEDNEPFRLLAVGTGVLAWAVLGVFLWQRVSRSLRPRGERPAATATDY